MTTLAELVIAIPPHTRTVLGHEKLGHITHSYQQRPKTIHEIVKAALVYLVKPMSCSCYGPP